MHPIAEALEPRRLLAGDGSIVQALPYVLEFNKPSGGVVDRDGQGTGLTYVQPNVTSTEYRKGRIDLRSGVSLLRLTSAGDNWENDNSLVNGLMTGFAASSRTFSITGVLKGPFSLADGQGAGIMFGPDCNNFIRLALVRRGANVGLEFVDEQKISGGFRHQRGGLGATNIGSVSSINRLELILSGNPSNGYVNAWYRINGNTLQQLGSSLVIKKDKRAAFFSANAKAGLAVFNSPSAASTIAAFDSFAITRGLPTPGSGGSGRLVVSSFTRHFNDVRGGGTSETKKITLSNNGSTGLTVSSIALTGTDAGQFTLIGAPGGSFNIDAGSSASFSVAMNAGSSTSLGIKTASISITSNGGSASVPLRGLATAGQGGSNEPSLQRVLELYQIGSKVGDSNAGDYLLDYPAVNPNDEVDLQQLAKAGSGSVTLEPLSVFGVGSSVSPTVKVGYYASGTKSDKIQLLTVGGTGQLTQTVNPVINGTLSFDPGNAGFSFYMQFPSMYPSIVPSMPGGTEAYGEDLFNTYDTTQKRKIHFYTYKDAGGIVVANTFIMAGEDLNAGYDSQDFVAIVRNVKPLSGPEIGFQNLDGAP